MSEHTRILAEHHHCDCIYRETIGQGNVANIINKTKLHNRALTDDAERELNLLRVSHSTENSPEMASSWDQRHAEVEVRRSRGRRREKQEGILKAAEWRLMRGLERWEEGWERKASSSVDWNKCCTGASTDKCSRGKANGSKCGFTWRMVPSWGEGSHVLQCVSCPDKILLNFFLLLYSRCDFHPFSVLSFKRFRFISFLFFRLSVTFIWRGEEMGEEERRGKMHIIYFNK